MSNSAIMWLLGTVIVITQFFMGLRFARSTQVKGKVEWFGRVINDPAEALKKQQKIGRIFMIIAPIFFVFWTLLLFGVLGPVEGFGADQDILIGVVG